MNALVKINQNEISQDVESLDIKVIKDLIEKFSTEKAAFTAIHEQLAKINLDDYVVIELLSRKAHSSSLHSLEVTLKKLSARYWIQLLNTMDLKRFMGKEDFDHEYTKASRSETDEFTKENVMKFLMFFWNTRHINYARKIDSVFCNLSHSYKNNRAAGINPLIIIHKTAYGTYENEGHIDDLRYACRQAFGKSLDFNKIGNESRNYGEWMTFDHDLVRIKLYQNGNYHIWLNQAVLERFNEVLSLLYPSHIGMDYKAVKRRAFDAPIE